jgi:hypothetical protein
VFGAEVSAIITCKAQFYKWALRAFDAFLL